MSNSICKNCGSNQVQKYCPECGQKTYSRLHIKDIISDFSANFFTLELPLLKTVKELTLTPEKHIKNYIDGQRVNYYKPFQYYILMLSIYLFIHYLLAMETFDFFASFNSENTKVSQDDMSQLNSMMKQFYIENMKYFMFLQIPICAWLFKVFFKKSNYNYTESFVIALYLLGHTLLISAVVFLLSTFLDLKTVLSISFVLTSSYFLWLLIRLYSGKIWKLILKSISVYMLYFILYGVVNIIITITRMYIYYNSL